MEVKSFFPILYFEKAEPVASANARSASRFESGVNGLAWLRFALGADV